MWQALGIENAEQCQYGYRKSLVRMIGSYLPFRAQPRIKVQLGHHQRNLARSLDSELDKAGLDSLTPSDDKDGLGLVSWLKTPRKVMVSAASMFHLDRLVTHDNAVVAVDNALDTSDNEQGDIFGDETDHEKKRIHSLEDELAKLKAQIAQMSLEQLQQIELPNAPPPPAATPVAPPPPPIRTTHDQVLLTRARVCGGGEVSHCDRPNMTTMLSEMSNIKLRNIARSPGGTPVRTKSQRLTTPINSDPASIIAHALQKKFSHSVFKDSPDKENSNPGSPFSPVTSPQSL